MFEPLTRKDILGILNLQLSALKKKMEEHGIRIDFSQKFIDYMSEKGYDPAYGARPIKRILQRELVNMLAKALIEGSISKERPVLVDVSGDQIVITSK